MHRCRHPPSPLPCHAAISLAPATLRRQRPSAPPSAGKTCSIEYHITRPVAPRAAKASAPLVNQPSSCPDPTNQIKQRRQIPHRSTSASVRTPPAVSCLEAFRTPASVQPLCPMTGRHPKTLNGSGRSIETSPCHRRAAKGRLWLARTRCVCLLSSSGRPGSPLGISLCTRVVPDSLGDFG